MECPLVQQEVPGADGTNILRRSEIPPRKVGKPSWQDFNIFTDVHILEQPLCLVQYRSVFAKCEMFCVHVVQNWSYEFSSTARDETYAVQSEMPSFNIDVC